MEEELRKQGFPSLDVYDVLWTLEQTPNHSLRLNELGQKVFLAKFNISRIVDRLVEQGLISKEVCPEDKRGVYATLTKDGLRLRKDIWQVYKNLIDVNFSSQLSPKDHIDLKKILSKIYHD